YTFSSIFFYTNRTALLRNGRFNNLEYGAYAPGTPDVFIDDPQFRDIWLGPQRCYLVANQKVVPRLESLVGREHLNVLAASGGKVVLTNRAVAQARSRKVPAGRIPVWPIVLRGIDRVFNRRYPRYTSRSVVRRCGTARAGACHGEGRHLGSLSAGACEWVHP